jgi:hypothetical protein
MNTHRARILVIDDARSILSKALRGALTYHAVDIARDVVDAIYRIDCAVRPYDLIFSHLTHGDLPGPALWAYLSQKRQSAASRVVFVVLGHLRADMRRSLGRVPEVYVALPLATEEERA